MKQTPRRADPELYQHKVEPIPQILRDAAAESVRRLRIYRTALETIREMGVPPLEVRRFWPATYDSAKKAIETATKALEEANAGS